MTHRLNPWAEKAEKPKSKYRPYKKRDRPTLKTMFKKKLPETRAERKALIGGMEMAQSNLESWVCSGR